MFWPLGRNSKKQSTKWLFSVVLTARFSHPVPQKTDSSEHGEIDDQSGPVQRQTRLSDEKVAALMQEYLAGSQIVDLARSYGINRKTTTALLRKNNVAMRPRYPVMDSDQIEEAARRYDSGSSFSSLAKTYRVHPATLKKYLVEAGVVPRT